MFSSIRSLTLASLAVLGTVNAATLSVSTTGGNASSPLLYGLMFEVLPLAHSFFPY
jgi:alpha-N-arabinofuranosidase